MILVDTSVWIDHFHGQDSIMLDLLERRDVLMHPMILGELAMGQPTPRANILADLGDLDQAILAKDQEVLAFVERHRLFGRGIGYIDVHLLASVTLTPGTRLWTRDRRLEAAAASLGLYANLLR